jgi:hypothetical protein
LQCKVQFQKGIGITPICNCFQATALLCRRFRFRRAGSEEDYEFEFAESGVEVGGDFGDVFEGLESLVFDVDYGEADGLQLPQDAR